MDAAISIFMPLGVGLIGIAAIVFLMKGEGL